MPAKQLLLSLLLSSGYRCPKGILAFSRIWCRHLLYIVASWPAVVLISHHSSFRTNNQRHRSILQVPQDIRSSELSLWGTWYCKFISRQVRQCSTPRGSAFLQYSNISSYQNHPCLEEGQLYALTASWRINLLSTYAFEAHLTSNIYWNRKRY